MSHIGQGQNGEVITASGTKTVWEAPAAGGSTPANDSNAIIAAQIFI